MTQQPDTTAPQQSAQAEFFHVENPFYYELERLWLQTVNLRYWLLGILALGLLGGLVVTLLSTERFRAGARIEISPSVPSATGTDLLEADNLARDRQYYETQYALLESRSLAQRVIDEGNLARDKEFLKAAGLSEGATAAPRTSEGSPTE